jgi:hypothetical protein
MNYKFYGLLILFYCFWIQSQILLSTNMRTNDKIIDRIHNSEFVNRTINYLEKNNNTAKFHIALTTFLIDSTLIGTLIQSIWTNNLRLPIVYLISITLRQICQFINRLPIPDHMIWFDPGLPTIFMVYEADNDFFFSGHTVTGLAAGVELIKYDNIFAKIYGLFFIIYQIVFVLITRCHYFMDVYAAIMTYFTVKYFYESYIEKKILHISS